MGAQYHRVSVVIPVFQNKNSLQEVDDRLSRIFKTEFPDLAYEVIYVDDGSTDGSYEELLNIAKKNSNARVLKLSKNFGQFAANTAGFSKASGDIVVSTTADLQDPPEVIVDLLNGILDGKDIMLAVRSKVRESLFRKFTSWLHYRLVALSVPSYPSRGFDFWAANKRAFSALMSFNDVIRGYQVDLLSIGFERGIVEYEKQKRVHGKSQYSFFKRLNVSFNQIFASAFWPLRCVTYLGVLFTSFGIIYSARLVYQYFYLEIPFLGWTPIMILLLMIGGLIMFSLGIIGEYLWRIYFEIKRRPLYFIDHDIGSK